MKINEYVIPENLETAYEILREHPKNYILGGCIGLNRNNSTLKVGIESKKILFSGMRRESGRIILGSLLNFHDLELDCHLYFSERNASVMRKSVNCVGGAQLRNHITVGGTVFSKFGSSDFLTLLSAYDAELLWYRNGRMRISEYLEMAMEKDILLEISINEENAVSVIDRIQGSSLDCSILNGAVVRRNGKYRICVGALPGSAKTAVHSEQFLESAGEINDDLLQQLIDIREELPFGSNIRASAYYRKEVCGALISRMMEAFNET